MFDSEKQFLKAAIRKFPLAFIFMALIVVLFGLMAVSGMQSGRLEASFGEMLEGLLQVALPFVFIPLALMGLYFYLARRFGTNIISDYVSALIHIFPPCFVMMGSVGGASMAVADGLVGDWKLIVSTFGVAFLYCQWLAVPWVLIKAVVRFFRRKKREAK